jgi:hypothetical protein
MMLFILSGTYLTKMTFDFRSILEQISRIASAASGPHYFIVSDDGVVLEHPADSLSDLGLAHIEVVRLPSGKIDAMVVGGFFDDGLVELAAAIRLY